MFYKQSLALGVAMIATGLSIVAVNHWSWWGWIILGIGTLLLGRFDIPFIDWKWGKFRPNCREIERMSAEEYEKHYKNPKFRRWVDWVYRKDAKHQKPLKREDF